MNKLKPPWYSLIFLMTGCVTACNVKNEKLTVTNLRCEYLDNPIGIDVINPRLGWRINLSKKVNGKELNKPIVEFLHTGGPSTVIISKSFSGKRNGMSIRCIKTSRYC